jgi:hypothetical protein
MGYVITELGHGILGYNYVVSVDDGAHLLFSQCKFDEGAEGAGGLTTGVCSHSGGNYPLLQALRRRASAKSPSGFPICLPRRPNCSDASANGIPEPGFLISAILAG